MKLRWGFKSEANKIARQVRRELRLGLAAPLDAWKLADHLGIPVLSLSSMKAEAEQAVRQLAREDYEAFSAVTVFRGYRRLIIVNDAHSRGRQASSLAHELAHSLLLHEPESAFDGEGTREWNAEQEDEAQWLAGALLVSEEAALRITKDRLSMEVAAQRYGTSVDMVRSRINVTASKRRVALGSNQRTLRNA